MRSVVAGVALTLSLPVVAAPQPAQTAAPATAAPHDTAVALLSAARSQLATGQLDSAAVLLRSVALNAGWPAAHRVEAWVLSGIVSFYRDGDSAATWAFRNALAIDSELQVPGLAQFDASLPGLLETARASPAVAAPAELELAEEQVYDCLRKCPDGVRPPRFVTFPRLSFDQSPFRSARLNTYLTVEAVISAAGHIEPGSVTNVRGTAEGAERVVLSALDQAHFAPGRTGSIPVRTRVALRFDFQADGANSFSYRYRVQAR